MGEQPVTVAIVNDYEIVVSGLAHLLEPYADRVAVVDREAGGVPDRPVDVALFDAFGSDLRDGARYSEILAAIGGGRLVVYGWAMQPDVVKGALARGASGYLSKKLSAEELVRAIERVASGEVVVAGDYDEDEVVEWTGGDWPGKTEGLSEREAEIVAWIASGLSNNDVADKVYLSINTVKSHIRTAYRKMGVETRSQAVLWAVEHGLRNPDSKPDDDAF